MSWIRPRSIRGQLIFGLVVLEGLLAAVFAILLVREQVSEIQQRALNRLQSEATLLARQAGQALSEDKPAYLEPMARAALTSPNIRAAEVIDSTGAVLASSDSSPRADEALMLFSREGRLTIHSPSVLRSPGGASQAIAPIRLQGRLRAYAWVSEDPAADRQAIFSLIRITVLFAALGGIGTVIVASVLAGSITRPLHALLLATGKLIRDPETKDGFPLEIGADNEAADLTRAFNLMVDSIDRQRSGLSDTLALLDSMLENAPVGFAFFDRKLRYVRVNQFLAGMSRLPVGRHLGRPIAEIMPASAAGPLEACVRQVFESGIAARDFELAAPSFLEPGQNRCWLVNVYPVRTATETVRWVGAIFVDTTDRRRSEETLRKTEKLAAAGRLAASVAHEINNPLEAITNLLYLLRHEPSLDAKALAYADSAQHEVARVAEMTQQTLRFYRQSTHPGIANIGEIMESVLNLLNRRRQSLRIEVHQSYGDGIDLYCFPGELRQLFANLVGNALDAMEEGGRLYVKIRRSRRWSDGSIGSVGKQGIRVFVADDGCGMSRDVRQRIFEPFFTTKEATGTGLGLWISSEIVQKHKGSMRVASRPRTEAGEKRSGAVFMIFFPEDGVPTAPNRDTRNRN